MKHLLNLLLIIVSTGLLLTACNSGFKANKKVELLATLNAHDIILSWTAPTQRENGQPLELSEIKEYRIYFHDTESSDYNSNQMVVVPSSQNSFVFEGLPSGTWFFVATAVDTLNNESKFSEEVSKVVP